MGYIARIPANVHELEENLTKIFENKSHVKGVHTNDSMSHLEVELDWSAHNFGGEAGKDFFLPIKRGKLRDAKDLVDHLFVATHAPSHNQAMELFDMIDPQGK